jgi:carbamoyl-phosphate synthase small subunit
VLLEDGALFLGTARRFFEPVAGEVVFTTNLTGYQEVFTDPSYAGQIVTMTAPMIGNYGINEEDVESDKPQVSAVVVRELSRMYSSWRATGPLEEWLGERQIPILEGIDTRRLTRHLRAAGAMRGIVAVGSSPSQDVRERLKRSPSMIGRDLASAATVRREYTTEVPEAGYHVVAMDFGMKTNILRHFARLSCRVTVVPATTSAARIRELQPDGLFLSNGPGDPAAVTYALPVIREIAESGLPVFGICLGHQLLALAFGGATMKLPYGHHGGNHPVCELASGRVMITSQNHGFAVKGTTKHASGVKQLEVTHRNLNDDTIEGVAHTGLPTFGVQYHPEAAPGPHDAQGHFEQFIQALDSQRLSPY